MLYKIKRHRLQELPATRVNSRSSNITANVRIIMVLIIREKKKDGGSKMH